MRRVPKALENLDMLLTPGMGQSVEELGRKTRWVLENTQAGIKKEGLEVTEPKKEVWELSTEELEQEIAELVRKSGYRLVPLENNPRDSETDESKTLDRNCPPSAEMRLLIEVRQAIVFALVHPPNPRLHDFLRRMNFPP